MHAVVHAHAPYVTLPAPRTGWRAPHLDGELLAVPSQRLREVAKEDHGVVRVVARHEAVVQRKGVVGLAGTVAQAQLLARRDVGARHQVQVPLAVLLLGGRQSPAATMHACMHAAQERYEAQPLMMRRERRACGRWLTCMHLRFARGCHGVVATHGWVYAVVVVCVCVWEGGGGAVCCGG